MKTFLNYHQNKLKILFISLLFVFIFYKLIGELSSIDYKATYIAFKSLQSYELAGLIISGFLAVMLLSLYDFVLAKNLNLSIPKKKLLNTSFIANALNAVIGFGGIIGAGLRLLVYRNYADDERTLVKAISLLLISMISGMSILSLGIIFNLFNNTHAFDHYPWYNIALIITALFLPVFLVYTFIKPVNQDKLLGLKFTLVSALEWIAASGVMYLIFKCIGNPVPFAVVIGIFVVAALAGLISLVPGGFGAFDLMILVGFKAIGITEEQVLLALLIYRVVYYFVPFLLALALSTFEYRGVARKQFEDRFEDHKYVGPAIETSNLFLSILRDVIVKLPAIALGVIVGITGLLLFLSNGLVIIEAIYDVKHNTYLFLAALYGVAALILIINAKGIMHDTRRSHVMSMVAVSILLIVVYLTYGNFLIYIWLFIVLILLFIGNRNVSSIRRPITLKRAGLTILSSIVLLSINGWLLSLQLEGLIRTENIDFDSNLLKYYFLLLIVLFAGVTYTLSYLFNKKFKTKVDMQMSTEEIDKIIQSYGGNFVSHLAFTGDKLFFTNDERDAFVMFQFKNDSIIVLGDPIGNKASFQCLLTQFYDKTEYYGYDVAFYQVQPHLLPMYHDFGNIFFKLGEEAVIPLEDFTISGKKKRAFRATVNKFETEGYRYEVLEPPFDDCLIAQLQEVSNEWLNGRNEMNFSVGQFNPDYLNKAPIGVIRNDAEIIGFVSFMPTHYNHSFSVDMIRWKDNELQMMDGLYLNTMLLMKEKGYHSFNMGMAPLSNVGSHKHAFYRERLAGKIFDSISRLYSFKGLRKYKEKFNPDWQSRYLVYRKDSSLITQMIRINAIINRSKKSEH
ncbi:bifunctional lysylphosphatidylglycerol flippase/synthetase MprF [Macrococcoides goetzii]|uniref:bifunctional lysylphosphatidylglycerol flippase/synthetase MprF n=1 Tax=Macrococcus sp. PK TaxID=2801919 RepID=UPI001F0E8D66|nr:bifunctional lysylphosphatidylglycerol flippase/synthetase MprF [Macrococcus sp. PK]MCH4984668.1 bifunctional lysylphosphatidylglycerol flippase/synthetase MprF [Macrococcus sp. PK]